MKLQYITREPETKMHRAACPKCDRRWLHKDNCPHRWSSREMADLAQEDRAERTLSEHQWWCSGRHSEPREYRDDVCTGE